MSWKKIEAEERQKAKFVKAGLAVNVLIDIPPHVTTVEGRYGKRKMYIIETKEYGAVYISPMQLLRIAADIGDLTKGFVVTTL